MKDSRIIRAVVACFLATAALVPPAWSQPSVPVNDLARMQDSDTATTMYEVNGLRVLQKRVTASDVVAANLYLLGGTRQVSEANAGIENFLLETSAYGTRSYSRSVLRNKLSALGSSIEIDPGADWTMIGFRATRATFDSTWALFAARITAPTLDSTAVELVRAQLLGAVRQRRDDPDALLNELGDSVGFSGSPYALDPLGSERSLRAITRRDLTRYLADQVVTSRMLLVVVGNVDRAQVESRVKATIGRLSRGQYTWKLPASPAHFSRAVVTVPQRLPTNYILAYYQGPRADDADYQRLQVACAVLTGRLFTEIRSRRNLTYAVNAPFQERAIGNGGIYVTTVFPDSTLRLIADQIHTLQTELVDSEGLERLVQQFITEYFLDNETNEAQADFLARAYLYRGDYHSAGRFVDELRKVTPEDIRRVAQRYMHDMRFAYVGDPSKLSQSVLDLF